MPICATLPRSDEDLRLTIQTEPRAAVAGILLYGGFRQHLEGGAAHVLEPAGRFAANSRVGIRTGGYTVYAARDTDRVDP